MRPPTSRRSRSKTTRRSAARPAAAAGVNATPDRDWELLSRIAAGEEELFAEIVERHQERLLRLCHRLLGSREEAEDACQTVFIKAFRSAGTLQRRGRLYTWLYRVATNHCLNQLRRRRVLRFVSLTRESDDETPLLEPVDERAAPDDRLAARRRWQSTRRCIAALEKVMGLFW